MSYKGIFEDSDESESGEDFSASEEDWKPGKGDVSSDEDEEVDLSENSEDDDEGPSQGKKSKNSYVLKIISMLSKRKIHWLFPQQ